MRVSRSRHSLPQQVRSGNALDAKKECRHCQSGREIPPVSVNECPAKSVARPLEKSAAENQGRSADPQNVRHDEVLPLPLPIHAQAEGKDQGSEKERKRDQPGDHRELGKCQSQRFRITLRYSHNRMLRLLSERDLPDLMALKASAGWNQTEAEWLLFLRLEPNGCFGIEADGRIVSSATCFCYGEQLAWIGMVLTLPEYRKRGYARRLTQAALDYAGKRTMRLDASDFGRPLYESLDFVEECQVDRWRRAPASVGPLIEPVCEPGSYDPLFDSRVFGANRSKLLSEFALDESASLPGAYAFGRPGANGPFFGPCVAETANSAASLLHWFVSRHAAESVYLDLFPHHMEAVRMARQFGFEPARHLTRMVRKPVIPELPDSRIYFTGSFSFG